MLSAENTYGHGGGGSLSRSRSTSPALSTKSMDLLPVIENKRKFSFPVALHSSSLLGDVNTLSARRRFSNVSDVVTRKLSSTIGWKLPTVVPTQDLVTQGKCLCGQYIRNRLKRSGLFTKKLGLQRLRSIIGTPSALIVREVFPALNYVRYFPLIYLFIIISNRIKSIETYLFYLLTRVASYFMVFFLLSIFNLNIEI